MKNLKKVSFILFGLSLNVNCGGSTTKNDKSPSPQIDPTVDSVYKPLKDVEEKDNLFSLGDKKLSCDEVISKLKDKALAFDFSYVDYQGISHDEKISFTVYGDVCDQSGAGMLLVARKLGKNSFHVDYNIFFNEKEGSLVFRSSTCHPNIASQKIRNLHDLNTPPNARENILITTDVNDNYCVPTINRMTEILTQTLNQ